MNRRQFLCGVAAAALVAPAAQASAQHNTDLARMAAEWNARVLKAYADSVKEAIENQWTTENLPFPSFCIARPPGWRDWYGTEGL